MQTDIRYFDSHAHLNDEETGAIQEVLAACAAAGVQRVMNVGSDVDDSALAVAQAQKYQGVYAAVGIHPHSALAYTPEWLERIESLAKAQAVRAYGEIGLDYHFSSRTKLLPPIKVRAYGEIGLDYHYGKDTKAQQLALFEAQLQLAARLGLPVLIHDRDAHAPTLELLTLYLPKLSGCVLHCFSGSAEFAAACLKLGCYISFSGSVTFKNAKNLQAAAKAVPLSRLLIETDCPYLTPVPLRGKWPNTPANLPHTAAFLAQLLELPPAELAEITWNNACAFYGLDT